MRVSPGSMAAACTIIGRTCEKPNPTSEMESALPSVDTFSRTISSYDSVSTEFFGNTSLNQAVKFSYLVWLVFLFALALLCKLSKCART
ncbi:hypothetical protein D3C87_1858190 [compost metagenome]